MPKQPVKRHVLAEVRIKCGLTQRELGELLGVAMITIQRIEQGSLALSEDLATKAERELNVSAAWLLANDSKQPAVARSGLGLWTKLPWTGQHPPDDLPWGDVFEGRARDCLKRSRHSTQAWMLAPFGQMPIDTAARSRVAFGLQLLAIRTVPLRSPASQRSRR